VLDTSGGLARQACRCVIFAHSPCSDYTRRLECRVVYLLKEPVVGRLKPEIVVKAIRDGAGLKEMTI
jgi:hypothetical protein